MTYQINDIIIYPLDFSLRPESVMEDFFPEEEERYLTDEEFDMIKDHVKHSRVVSQFFAFNRKVKEIVCSIMFKESGCYDFYIKRKDI